MVALTSLVIEPHHSLTVHRVDQSVLEAMSRRWNRGRHLPYDHLNNSAIWRNVLEVMDELRMHVVQDANIVDCCQQWRDTSNASEQRRYGMDWYGTTSQRSLSTSGKITLMFHVILVEPEIPPNTGNVIRLCANTGSQLHLVKPLGFELDDRRLRRAGLDYHEWQPVLTHDSLEQALQATGAAPQRCFCMTTRGSRLVAGLQFQPGDVFVFGRETAGLSAEQREMFDPAQRIRLPMMTGQRSLNLSNAVAVVLYEAWRQNDYINGV